MKKTKDTNKGITLIALVITIIVMLILVAVTITMAVNGGLFDYASSAGRKTNAATAAEQAYANLEENMTVNQLIDKYTGWTGEGSQGGTTTITFTIEGESYTAASGMTWKQWIDSTDYDSDGYSYSARGYVYDYNEYYVNTNGDSWAGFSVKPTDQISDRRRLLFGCAIILRIWGQKSVRFTNGYKWGRVSKDENCMKNQC